MRFNTIKPRQLGSLSTLILAAAASFPAASLAADAAATNAQLEERIRVLERKLELSAEEAAAAKKETPVVTASDKGFGLKSANGQYEVRFTGLGQVDGRFFLADDGQFDDGFVTRRLRPTIQGSLGKLVAFRFTPEFAGTNGVGDSASIVDAYFDLKFSPLASVRIGKQKGLLGLERLQSGGNISFIERGYVTELVPNRDLGVAVYGEALQGTVSYAGGVFNGTADGRDVSTADDGSREFEGRVFLEPFKNEYGLFRGLGIGVAGSTGVKDATGNNVLPRYRTPGQNQFFGYSTDTATPVQATGEHHRIVPQGYFYKGSVGLLAEYAISEQTVRRSTNFSDVKATGYNVVAGYVLTGEDASYKGVKPSRPFAADGGWGALEVVGRVGGLKIGKDAFDGTGTSQLASLNTSAREATTYGIGVNWYLTANAKIVADYNYTTFVGGLAGGRDRADERALFTRLSLQY